MAGLRLVLWIALCEAPEAVNLMGPDCSSWGVPARGTPKRSYLNPDGLTQVPFVQDGNRTAARRLD